MLMEVNETEKALVEAHRRKLKALTQLILVAHNHWQEDSDENNKAQIRTND